MVLLLFVFSGGEKLFNVTSNAKVLQSKIGAPLVLCTLVILGVIVLELVGSGPCQQVRKRNLQSCRYCVLATLLFHMSEPSQILKNLSVIGGLTLLYDRL